jgi:hypothetical protein
MTFIDEVDLDIYCGRVGNLYVRHGLCPPFALRDVAADWKAIGIAIAHIVAVIDCHLTDHRRRYHNGSGDALFGWLAEHVRRTWEEKKLASPWTHSDRATVPRTADRESTEGQPSADHESDLRRRPSAREAPLVNQSDASGCGRAHQAPQQSAQSIGQKRTGLKRIDQAIAFLRRELADGEVAATHLEEKAKANGISPRTLDRARTRLNVTCRRTGFAKSGKSWLSLTAPKRRRVGRQKRGKREKQMWSCRE